MPESRESEVFNKIAQPEAASYKKFFNFSSAMLRTKILH